MKMNSGSFVPLPVTSREGRVSRNDISEMKPLPLKVTSREGRVSRNRHVRRDVCVQDVTSREGRVSRNAANSSYHLLGETSRPARDV